MRNTLLLITVFIFSCTNSIKEPKTENRISEEVIKDKNELKLLVNNLILKKENPFFQKFYDSLTQIEVDTIFYNPDKSKLAFFVINKVENKKRYLGIISKQSEKIKKLGNLSYEGYHYNANAFIGKRSNNRIIIKDFSVINISKYESIDNIRKRLRKLYFEEYSRINEDGYEYNLDDNEFWNNNIWENWK